MFQIPAMDLKAGDFIKGVGVVQSAKIYLTQIARTGSTAKPDWRDTPAALLELEIDTWTAEHIDSALNECYAYVPSSVTVEGQGFQRQYRAQELVSVQGLPIIVQRKVA